MYSNVAARAAALVSNGLRVKMQAALKPLTLPYFPIKSTRRENNGDLIRLNAALARQTLDPQAQYNLRWGE